MRRPLAVLLALIVSLAVIGCEQASEEDTHGNFGEPTESAEPTGTQ